MIYSYIPESRAGSDAFDPWAATREPYPAPKASSLESRALEFPLPSAVTSLIALAKEYWWAVRVQYSRGRLPHATTSRPGALKDLIGLRFGLHPETKRQAYAVYSRTVSGGTWTWSSVMIWGPDLPPYPDCLITELKTYLECAPDWHQEALEGWVRKLRMEKAEAIQRAAQRAAERGPVSKNREVGG